MLVPATNKLLRICRPSESPVRALFKLYRVRGITLSSRNLQFRSKVELNASHSRDNF
jgi:hypothetical protein